MDMMTMLLLMMLMDDGFGSGGSSQPTESTTNENDIWKALVLTLPDILGAFGFGSD